MEKFVSILLAVVLIFSVLTCVGCEADKKEENTITYYHYEPQVSTVSSFIYDYNKKFGNTDYKINVVEFDDMKEMASRLSTEIMAGEGPDIITSAELEMLSSSIEKLIKQKTFANLDDILTMIHLMISWIYQIIILIFSTQVFMREKDIIYLLFLNHKYY